MLTSFSVYHFTDIPSFVSGDYLVIFDPHVKHLPFIDASKPGLKIDVASSGIVQQFPDQFLPYHHFGCNMSGSYQGTSPTIPLCIFLPSRNFIPVPAPFREDGRSEQTKAEILWGG
jgi:hypothetical protein